MHEKMKDCDYKITFFYLFLFPLLIRVKLHPSNFPLINKGTNGITVIQNILYLFVKVEMWKGSTQVLFK